jgi:hypothetical protein
MSVIEWTLRCNGFGLVTFPCVANWIQKGNVQCKDCASEGTSTRKRWRTRGAHVSLPESTFYYNAFEGVNLYFSCRCGNQPCFYFRIIIFSRHCSRAKYVTHEQTGPKFTGFVQLCDLRFLFAQRSVKESCHWCGLVCKISPENLEWVWDKVQSLCIFLLMPTHNDIAPSRLDHVHAPAPANRCEKFRF